MEKEDGNNIVTFLSWNTRNILGKPTTGKPRWSVVLSWSLCWIWVQTVNYVIEIIEVIGAQWYFTQRQSLQRYSMSVWGSECFQHLKWFVLIIIILQSCLIPGRPEYVVCVCVWLILLSHQLDWSRLIGLLASSMNGFIYTIFIGGAASIALIAVVPEHEKANIV